MNKVIVAIALMIFASHATAASTCAAHASFMKKCQANAKATCESTAKEKNLHGAAQGSFIKKCVKDSVGS